MVNQKRVEQKIPLLLIDNPWNFEQDRYEYRLKQFKKREPKKFQVHSNNILNDLERLKRDLDAAFKNTRK